MAAGNTYLFLLLVEVVDDDADEEVQGEEGTKDDEDDEVDVHVEVDLVHWLLFNLPRRDGKCDYEANPLQKHVRKPPGQGSQYLNRAMGWLLQSSLANAAWVEWS